MFLNSIILGFFLQASGAVKKYQISHLFSVIYAIFLLSLSPLLKFPSAWTDMFLMAFPWSLAAAGVTWVGMWIENYKKNPGKPQISLVAHFTEIYVQVFNKKPSTHFKITPKFLGAFSDKDFQRQGAEAHGGIPRIRASQCSFFEHF